MKLIFRWLINSIIFPYTYNKMSRRINKMSELDRAIELAMFTGETYWFNKYWFGRAIKEMWIRKVAKINTSSWTSEFQLTT